MSFPHMDQVDRKLYERQIIFTAPFEAGLKEIFDACHEPFPKEMEVLIRRLEEALTTKSASVTVSS